MAQTTRPHESRKHQIIKKTNLTIVIAVSVAVFIVIFSLFAARSLFGQASYNQRVINEKKEALKIAEQNVSNVKDLEESYISFASEPINIIGGSPTGTGPQDGTNPKIVLDSLPSEYDYPALSSSIEKILLDNSYQIDRIGGTEDPSLSTDVSIGDDSLSTSNSVVEVTEIPYPLSVISTAEGTKNLLDIFERSIRPFYVEKITITGSDASMTAKITMKTFYQPATGFVVSKKAVD
jgi:hypothetical protein